MQYSAPAARGTNSRRQTHDGKNTNEDSLLYIATVAGDRMSLYGYVRNANVTIYKDYHIIYQSPKIEEEDGWYFSDTGDYMISVPLKQTDGGKKIQVLVTAGKDEIKNIQFYYGTGDGFMRMILKDEMTRMTILTITIILGAISIMLSKTLDPGIEAVSGNYILESFAFCLAW